MPLLVTLIWPSRKALLLFGSSHDSVPGMKLAYSSLAYSSALSVSGLSSITLLFLSTSFPPKANPLLAIRPHEHLARRVPAAVFLAEVFRQIGDVEELVRIEVRVVVGRQ